MRALLSNFFSLTKTQINLNKNTRSLLITSRHLCVATNNQEINEKAELQPPQALATEQKQRSLHVAVIGVPNAGKSTFINNLINHRVCPTSCKVHTTRKANKAIYTTDNTQLVFYDTPGLVTQKEVKKHKLEKTFMSAYRHAIQHADLITVMHDVSNSWTRKELHSTVIDTLKAYSTLPSILVLNKIDALKSKRILLELIRTLTNDTLTHNRKQNKKMRELQEEKQVSQTNEFGNLHKRQVSWSNFSDIFLVSSITGNGLSDVHDYLVTMAKDRAWQYPRETFTDESPEGLIVDSVRARLLDYLPQEIPYNLRSQIEFYGMENNTIYASVQVICATTRIEKLICGESNGKLRQITERVTSDLVETFGKPISLTITTSSTAN